MNKYKEEKIKVISKERDGDDIIVYQIGECHGVCSVKFQYSSDYGWCLVGSNYLWNRSFMLFAEAIIRGLNS